MDSNNRNGIDKHVPSPELPHGLVKYMYVSILTECVRRGWGGGGGEG